MAAVLVTFVDAAPSRFRKWPDLCVLVPTAGLLATQQQPGGSVRGFAVVENEADGIVVADKRQVDPQRAAHTNAVRIDHREDPEVDRKIRSLARGRIVLLTEWAIPPTQRPSVRPFYRRRPTTAPRVNLNGAAANSAVTSR